MRALAPANFRGLHIHLYELVQHYFIYVLGPAIVVLLLLLLFLAWKHPLDDTASDSLKARSLSTAELGLALGLALLPAIGIVGIKISHAYYFDRYFLAATAGYACCWRRPLWCGAVAPLSLEACFSP